MQIDRAFVDKAAKLAETLLAPLGNRWLHVQAVAQKAHTVSTIFNEKDGLYLLAAAYLHDIGYAPSLKQTGFHPIDGARYVSTFQLPRLVSLVAHHSEARFEARLRGLEDALAVFPREESPVADALTYCDITTSPIGETVTLDERIAEVASRYGKDHLVSQALQQAYPSLSLAVKHTTKKLLSLTQGSNAEN